MTLEYSERFLISKKFKDAEEMEAYNALLIQYLILLDRVFESGQAVWANEPKVRETDLSKTVGLLNVSKVKGTLINAKD